MFASLHSVTIGSNRKLIVNQLSAEDKDAISHETDHQEPKTVRTLDIVFEERNVLQRNLLHDPPVGGVMVRLKGRVRIGEVVTLKILLVKEGIEEILRGVILWIRKEAGRSVAGVGFLPSEEARKERLIKSKERRSTRHRMEFQVNCHTYSGLMVGMATNISEGGMFVREPCALPVGAQLRIEANPPDLRVELKLHGRVAWICPGVGFGVHFTRMTPNVRNYLMSLSK
jgi:Tfp pilus assembly protein PilZ